jgi:catechol 2,3-dioxygenase-like lactoylglutathione lyase family enzyme
VIDHIGFEVSDLGRSGQFYDAVFFRLGGRRLLDTDQAIAYGISAPELWIVVRGRPPAPAYGHVALAASGRAAVDAAYTAGLGAGGTDAGAPGPRPHYGSGYYAAYLHDPDALRVEVVSRR